jgi:hypothetical protein
MDDKKDDMKKARTNEDLKEVSRAWGPMEAELVKNFLESHGISCLVRGRTVPFVYPFTVDGLAEFKVFVQAGDFDAAKALLQSLPEDGEDVTPEKPE